LVDVVVGDVAGHNGAQAGDVNYRRRERVGLADHDDSELVFLELDHVAVEGVRCNEVARDLIGEHPVPELLEVGGELLLGLGDDGRVGDRSGAGERVEDRLESEEVIAVAMGDVDRGEVFAARAEPVDELRQVLGQVGGVDEDGVPLAADQRVGDRGEDRLVRAHPGSRGDDLAIRHDEGVKV
jgi:hypothetical protein